MSRQYSDDPSVAASSLRNADGVVQSHAGDNTSIPSPSSPSDRRLVDDDDDDDDVISHLLASERHYMPHRPHYLRLPPVTTFRLDSISWILKVNAHYHFKPVTAYLSVNYFDRFLSLHSLLESGWPYQLLAVTCVSLAAKMEEPNVPLLIDLQVCEPSYVFEPKTIQRMELLVIANLNWRLRAVTPFDYIHYFISKLFGSQPGPFADIVSLSSDLILNTTRDFLGFASSEIAAAAVMCAAGEGVNSPEAFYERVNKEMVRSCHQIMEAYLVDTCPSADQKVRRLVDVEPASPPSPSGVLEAAAACVSCDTRSQNPAAEPDVVQHPQH